MLFHFQYVYFKLTEMCPVIEYEKYSEYITIAIGQKKHGLCLEQLLP